MINEITPAHISSPLLFGNLGASFSAALATLLTEFVLFIPRIVEALIILLVGYIIVSVVIKVLRFTLQKVNLERHLGQTNLGKTVEKSGQTITNIALTVVKWLLLLVVIVYAVSVLSIAPLTISMLAILAWLPDLAGAIIIIFVGALIASYVGKAIANTLPRYGVGGARIIALAVELLIYALVINFAMIQIGFGQGIIYTASTALSSGTCCGSCHRSRRRDCIFLQRGCTSNDVRCNNYCKHAEERAADKRGRNSKRRQRRKNRWNC